MIKTIVLLISLTLVYSCSEVILPYNPSYRFIIAFEKGRNLSEIRDELEVIEIDVINSLDIINAISCCLNEDQKDEIQTLSYIRYIEPDYELFMLDTNLPMLTFTRKYDTIMSDEVQDWGIKYIKAPEVWSISTGKNVRVAVVDTGVSVNHPDLQGSVVGGYDAINGKSYEDDNDHGTYVSTIIAARRNGVGIVGVAPEAEIYAVKVMDNEGKGFISDAIKGCQWALEQKIPVINLSLGANFESIAMQEAIAAMAEEGVIIAATGNEGKQRIFSPARDSVTLCVGGAGMDGNRASWSNYGVELKINGVLAPGDWIMVGEKSGGWRRVSGTSVAAPYVTGLFALLLQISPESVYSLRDYVLAGASMYNQPDEFIGHGIIDAKKSVNLLLEN